MTRQWRLLDQGPMTAAENMALDDTLLELKGQGKTPDTIRFLQFLPRAVLVGFHQAIDAEIRTDYCRSHGIDINRRITGGGAIFLDEGQLGWEIICDKGFFDVKFVDQNLFRKLCVPLITALERLGVASVFRPRNDVEINGRKISGTGGTEFHGAFLFHGTLLIDFDVDTMLRTLQIPVEKLKAKEIDSLKERVTCLKWELEKTPPLEEIKAAVIYGFEKHFGIELVTGGLTEIEDKYFKGRIAYYQSKEWVDRIGPQLQNTETIQASHKSEAGLVRFTLDINRLRRKIKNVYITGDFLSFPTRALYDLEYSLRGADLDFNKTSEKIKTFFQEGQMVIPGMDINDFINPVKQIFEKIADAATS
ncbi:MAG: lipoate--protein ligase family protein [Desulfobacteraceae bacterium]|nr:lipoate--protein ligase family protein [Desulfobacteraceae bacterium]